MRKFFTFEGGEGSGKSTQAKLLYKSIKKVDEKVILTREPGGTIQAEKIRKILVNKSNEKFDSITELLLINAARNEHLKNLIIPELKNNKVIICDRFIDSTYAYQIIAQNINMEIFNVLNKLILKDIFPSVTFLIDLEPSIGIKRSLKEKNIETKYENLSIDFHNMVRNAFKKQSENERRIRVIDGKLSKKEIHIKIIDEINILKILDQKIDYIL